MVQGIVANAPRVTRGILTFLMVAKVLRLGISMGVVATCLTILYWGVKQWNNIKRREKFFEKNGGLMLRKLLFECEGCVQIVKIFTEKELRTATNEFKESNIIGQGGFGTVYKGTLANNTMVAIKKSKVIDQSQIEQFVNEVIILSRINHPNVVKLLGCCLETPVPLLVNEYVTNKTLFHHIHEQGCECLMPLEVRLKIAAETAEALAHMHSATQIIHRDVKSANILLNDEYTAKVSDFGISRFVPLNATHLSTLVQGTFGYIDPTYFRSGNLTEKSDVYSFGVVLVELLTGEKVLCLDRPEEDGGLAEYFHTSLAEKRLLQVLDDQVKKDGYTKQLKSVCELAKVCLELERDKRPTMKEVNEELQALRENCTQPTNHSSRKST
ncbi:hypothetical protein RJ639_007617 [Escallonia herrerae]|uniref:Protein kinase domain-containing protein n=1 Tax=Escallonia herrerae TaxID=1293975 RepID=A0AA88VY72_9ASTE|nr:hypothetical protein RJ639_007617 [Escallonia herrerae]